MVIYAPGLSRWWVSFKFKNDSFTLIVAMKFCFFPPWCYKSSSHFTLKTMYFCLYLKPETHLPLSACQAKMTKREAAAIKVRGKLNWQVSINEPVKLLTAVCRYLFLRIAQVISASLQTSHCGSSQSGFNSRHYCDVSHYHDVFFHLFVFHSFKVQCIRFNKIWIMVC